jgi:hypothetical protein
MQSRAKEIYGIYNPQGERLLFQNNHIMICPVVRFCAARDLQSRAKEIRGI